jgi:hypothetical protein
VGQFLGIGHDVDRADSPVVHLDREHRLGPAPDLIPGAKIVTAAMVVEAMAKGASTLAF